MEEPLDQIIRDRTVHDITHLRGFERCEVVSVERGSFEMRAHPGQDCVNNMGSVHGGFLLTLADIAASAVADSYGFANVTMSLASNFLRPAFGDDEFLRVVGKAVHAGRRSTVVEVSIERPDGTVAFKATITMAMFADQPLVKE